MLLNWFQSIFLNQVLIRINSKFLHSLRTHQNYKSDPRHFWWNTLYYAITNAVVLLSEIHLFYLHHHHLLSFALFRKFGSFIKMLINPKLFAGISSNFVHSIRTSIIFSENGSFLKMVITRKFELGISSNFLHSIRTSMCIWKCNKNFWWFRSHFLEKTMGYSMGKFSEIGSFF